MKSCSVLIASTFTVMSTLSYADTATFNAVVDDVIASQRQALSANTDGKGFGPQSPRDIDQTYGLNKRVFNMAPERSQMNLCNIHFHKGAEHKGGEFNTYAGNGDGKGNHTGFLYDGRLNEQQMKPVYTPICAAKGQSLAVGDTIEVHFVHSSAQVKPGPTLGACLADSTMNPQLRVEAQVLVLANDDTALDFTEMARVEQVNGYYQAPNVPSNTGKPVSYAGSTTGPSYNEIASPLQVSWSVRPNVAVVDIETVGKWCENNAFDEDHAHGVRNLVINPQLLSPIR